MRVLGFSGPGFDEVRILEIDPYRGAAVADSAQVLHVDQTWHFPIVGSGTCNPAQAISAIELWNALPDDDQARCHNPGFAIQLFGAGNPLWTAALCWQCNNISIGGPQASLKWRTFAADSPLAKALLQLCKEVAGRSEPRLLRAPR